MAINAFLTIDGGRSLAEITTFEVKPGPGEVVSFRRGGWEHKVATVTRVHHQQGDDGFLLIVEADTV